MHFPTTGSKGTVGPEIAPPICFENPAAGFLASRSIMGYNGIVAAIRRRLACAELSGCDYLVTCDDRLIRQGQKLKEKGTLGLNVINPIDLLREV
jgi:hypothetical protein